jgi:hypothetical protein
MTSSLRTIIEGWIRDVRCVAPHVDMAAGIEWRIKALIDEAVRDKNARIHELEQQIERIDEEQWDWRGDDI